MSLMVPYSISKKHALKSRNLLRGAEYFTQKALLDTRNIFQKEADHLTVYWCGLLFHI